MQQEKYIADLMVLKEKFEYGYEKLSDVQSTKLKTFVQHIIDTANDLKICVPCNYSNQIWQNVKCVDFISTVSNINVSSLFNIKTCLKHGRDLQRCIEKLNDRMKLLVDVYDRIDSYVDKAAFATYIANIASANYYGTDHPKMNSVIFEVNKMIETNIILEHYEIAMNAYKQHKFPFAHLHMAQFELPENLQFHDIDGLKKKAITQIESLTNELHKSKTLLAKYDQDIVTTTSTIFYDEIKDDIIKLLQGEEIIVNADIAKGLNQNAVKFKEIAIHFKLKSETEQNEFDTKLNNFRVTTFIIDMEPDRISCP